MWNLIKGIFRYSLKNKGSFIGIFFLIYIAIATFSCFGTLNTNLINVYDNLTQNYKLHNVVVNELYDSEDKSLKQSHFRTWLSSQENFEYRDFDSLDVSTNIDNYKLIKYNVNSNVDKLATFYNSDKNWFLNQIYHPYNLNDIAFQAQITQSELIDIIDKKSMSEFARSDYLNKNKNWYENKNNINEPNQLKFGYYQDENDDLVIDAYVVNNDNKWLAKRANFLILNKKNFKSFSKLKLSDYSNNASWMFQPSSNANNLINSSTLQQSLEKITIKQKNTNEFKNNVKFNSLKFNDSKIVEEYINDKNENYEIINDNKIRNYNSVQLLNILSNNKINNYNLYILPSKEHYHKNNSVHKYVDFLFKQINNKSKLETYVIKNIIQPKWLFSRQLLFSFASNGFWSSNSDAIKNEFNKLELFNKNNPIFNVAWISNTAFKNSQNELIQKFNKEFPNNYYIDMAIDGWIKNESVTNKVAKSILLNGYKIVFDLSSATEFVSGYFIDPNALGAVVSHSWLEENKKEIFTVEMWNKYNLSNLDGKKSLNNILETIDDKYKIQVDSIPYLILDSGITPDFMYPVINFENIIPNPKNQAIVYVGETGYLRTFESFQNNPQEKMLLGKYNGNDYLSNFIGNLNNEIVNNNLMVWPKGTDAVFSFDSKENKITPTTIRVEFTSSIIKTISSFSYSISFFIFVIVLIVMLILIRQYVVKNRATLGIMIANGYSKIKIIFALSILGFIPTLTGGLLGYIVGYSTHTFAIGLFKSYWLLPINSLSFSVLFLLFSILVPAVIFVFMTLAIGAWSLRGSTLKLLAKTQTIKVGLLAKTVNKGMKKIPIMIRFRSNIILSTIYRLFTLSIMTSLVIVSCQFMASTINSFPNTNAISSKEKEYKFAIDLYSPTNTNQDNSNQSNFYGIPYSQMGTAFLKENGSQGLESNIIYKNLYKKNNLMRKYSNIHFPSAGDKGGQENNINFLKYKTQIRELLNFWMVTTNPWEFAQNMMPTNQANLAINSTKIINNKLMSDTRLMTLETFLGIQIKTKKYISNFPKKININNLGNKFNKNNIFTPGLSLIESNNNVIKPMHIINFNNQKNLNFNNSLDLVIDINQLDSNHSNDMAGFINLGKEKIIDSINNFYFKSEWKNAFNLKANGIIKKSAIKNINIQISKDNPNVIDINFQNYKNTNEILEVNNVLTNRSLFVGYYYNANQQENKPKDEWKKLINQNLNNWFRDPLVENEVYYNLDSNNVVPWIILMNTDYITYVLNFYKDPLYSKDIFRITYGLLSLDDSFNAKQDQFEPYVYVDSEINQYNNSIVSNKPLTKYLANNEIKFIGIVDNSNYVKLFDKNNKNINYLLENWINFNYEIPLIVNEFAVKKYGLKINDKIKIKPKNTMDRFGKILNPNYQSEDAKNANNYSLVVKGISQSFNDSLAYIPINAAQSLLGIQNKLRTSIPKLTNAYTNFNGLFVTSETPYPLTNTIGLYSPSGLYPGSNSWYPVNDNIYGLIKNVINNKFPSINKTNYDALNVALGSKYFKESNTDVINLIKQKHGFNSKKNDKFSEIAIINEIAKKLSDTYGSTTYQSAVMNVNAVESSDIIFQSLTKTVISLEATVLTLIFFISLVVMMILIWIMLMDLMPLLALLATMGVNVWSNSLTFACVLIPTWFLSGIISLPIIFSLLTIFKEVIFSGMGILLIAPFNWWAYILILSIIALLFGVVYILGANKLSKIDIVNAIKR